MFKTTPPTHRPPKLPLRPRRARSIRGAMESSVKRHSRLPSLPSHCGLCWFIQQIAVRLLRGLRRDSSVPDVCIATHCDLQAELLTTLESCAPKKTLQDQLRLRRQCQVQRLRSRRSQPLHDSVTPQHGDCTAQCQTQESPSGHGKVLLLSSLHRKAGDGGSNSRLLRPCVQMRQLQELQVLAPDDVDGVNRNRYLRHSPSRSKKCTSHP
jgi:hypothetical protein